MRNGSAGPCPPILFAFSHLPTKTSVRTISVASTSSVRPFGKNRIRFDYPINYFAQQSIRKLAACQPNLKPSRSRGGDASLLTQRARAEPVLDGRGQRTSGQCCFEDFLCGECKEEHHSQVVYPEVQGVSEVFVAL